MVAEVFADKFTPIIVDAYERRRNRSFTAWFVIVMALTALVGWLMLQDGPKPNAIAAILYVAGVVAIIYQPRYGVYLIALWGLMSDILLMPWFPFTKNFTSGESILAINNRTFIFSPLESYLALTLLSWIIGETMRRKLKVYQGILFWPAMAFASFVVFGLVWGVTHHGNSNIALWEARPILYLPLMLVLTSNLIRTRSQANTLMWLAMTGIFVQGVAGVYIFAFVLQGRMSRIESIVEHASAVRMDTLFVFAIAAWLYHATPAKRYALPLMSLPVLLPFVVAQRRAAFVSLGVALVLIMVVVYQQNRRLFWRIAPPMAVFAVGYLGAFWNNQGALGLPARALKSVLLPDGGSAQENSSNAYRVVENINNSFTIHQAPLTGVGFGKPFYIIAQLPDISFFEWWQYITHNSMIWFWMQTGVGGFFAMIFLVSTAIVAGVRALWRMPGGDMSAIALVAVLYVVMHFTYAYVDMSWDNQSMMYMGMMMGLVCRLPKIVSES